MQNKTIYLFSLLTFLFLSAKNADAQQTINVSSHSATIQGNTFDYSIGEMSLITTEKNTNLIVTQGFLQPNILPNEVQTPPANTPIALSDLIKVYPNPTENILNVESIENADAEISYQLFDATGKVVLSEKAFWKAGNNKVSLDLKNFAAGSYYLMIRKPNANGNLENFSYKIQKTN